MLGAGSGWRSRAWSLGLAVLACIAVRQSWRKRKAALGREPPPWSLSSRVWQTPWDELRRIGDA
ncbi:hypothetical protein [Lysobacter sp. 1R34A]|uniref:hypothetical protein n=1 Tax=Lysobacter sp. 1R34A TaxID=3445786 RepID=UPI003EEE8F56